jgi:actin beta/gamma 1
MPDTAFQVLAPTGRKIAAWVGGSIIASVGTFDELWISRKEYDDNGTSIFAVKAY